MSSTTMVVFADVVALVTTETTSCILEEMTNNALDKIAEWLTRSNLTLSVSKTEAVMLTTKRDYDMPNLEILGERVAIKYQIKYLELELHRVLGFRVHLEAATKKA
jgi:hypothetical protein